MLFNFSLLLGVFGCPSQFWQKHALFLGRRILGQLTQDQFDLNNRFSLPRKYTNELLTTDAHAPDDHQSALKFKTSKRPFSSSIRTILLRPRPFDLKFKYLHRLCFKISLSKYFLCSRLF